MVNRIWHHLFDRGIVATADNFGLQGTYPSHPQLLDHLAIYFMQSGWSVKAMIRYIVSSEAFRRATVSDGPSSDIDPLQIYLTSYPSRRLEAEAIRDAILAVSGTLDPTLSGPSIPIHLNEFLQGRGRPAVSGPIDGYGRRSLYLALWRNFLPPMLITFDMPIPFSTTGVRNVTNVPAQALTLLNDPFVIQQAARWANRLMHRHADGQDRVSQAYMQAFARRPTPDELEAARQFVADQEQMYRQLGQSMAAEKAWSDYCHSLFTLKEFIYLL